MSTPTYYHLYFDLVEDDDHPDPCGTEECALDELRALLDPAHKLIDCILGDIENADVHYACINTPDIATIKKRIAEMTQQKGDTIYLVTGHIANNFTLVDYSSDLPPLSINDWNGSTEDGGAP